jgi:hypothetical protein
MVISTIIRPGFAVALRSACSYFVSITVGDGVCDLSEFEPLWLVVWVSVVIVVASYKHYDSLNCRGAKG